MENIIDHSPSKIWRSTEDNIACNIVLDIGTNERFDADAVAFFGCNFKDCNFQMHTADAWGAPDLSNAVSFTLATGTIDAVSGNYVKDTSLMADYKDHVLKDKYFTATSGTDDGVVWKILDNVGDYIVLDTTAATNLGVADTFAIFASKVADTFTETLKEFMRINITAQHTVDDYYKIGYMVVGKKTTLTKDWRVGYTKEHVYDIALERTPHGGLIPIKGADKKNRFMLEWTGQEDAYEEVIAFADYLEGKNMALVPDDSTLTDVYLVKFTGNISAEHVIGDQFNFGIELEEIL